jgi:hypothetical protein
VDAGYFCYLERGRRVPSVIVAEVLIDSFVQAARQGDALADEDLAWLDSIEDHVKGTPVQKAHPPDEPPVRQPSWRLDDNENQFHCQATDTTLNENRSQPSRPM